MVDKLTPSERSRNMGRIRSKNTSPELIVRKLTFSLGYRYRLHRKDLPGKPDLVFPGKKKVIFVQGCFWHQHQDVECKIARIPKSRTEYWLPKLQRNVERDLQHRERLEKLGWDFLDVWECEVTNPEIVVKKIEQFLPRSKSV